ITAESVADPNQRTTALVTLLPASRIPPPVIIEPDRAELTAGEQRQFRIRAEGDDPTAEVSLDPPSGLGTLALVDKNEGQWIFKAPDTVERPTTVSIVARSPKAPDDPVKTVVFLRPGAGSPQGPSRDSGSPTEQRPSRAKAPGRRKGSRSLQRS